MLQHAGHTPRDRDRDAWEELQVMSHHSKLAQNDVVGPLENKVRCCDMQGTHGKSLSHHSSKLAQNDVVGPL